MSLNLEAFRAASAHLPDSTKIEIASVSPLGTIGDITPIGVEAVGGVLLISLVIDPPTDPDDDEALDAMLDDDDEEKEIAAMIVP